MMQTLNTVALLVVYIAACLGVVAAVICRVDEMTRKRNKLSWFAMYTAYALYAMAALLDTIKAGEWNFIYLGGLAAIGLNLAVTLPHWRHGAPPASCRPGCTP